MSYRVAKPVRFTLIIIVMLMLCGYCDSHYTVKCKVEKVDGDIVTFRADSGGRYRYVDKAEVCDVGDKVSLTIFTSHTDDPDDDIIVGTKGAN